MHLIIDLIIIVIVLGIQYADTTFETESLWIGCILLLLNHIYWIFKSMKRKFSGSLFLKYNRKTLNIMALILAPCYTFLLGDYRLLLIFWTLFLVEIFSWLVYYLKKPNYLIIDNQTLIINGLGVSQRKLDEIKSIKIDTVFKYLSISFSTDFNVYIYYKQLKKDGYYKLIDALVEKVPPEAVVDQEVLEKVW